MSVIMGEYGAISKMEDEDHAAYRKYYLEYVTKSAFDHGLVPVYWDNGDKANHGFALFDRVSGEQLYPELIDVIVSNYE